MSNLLNILPNITTIDITKRCNYNSNNTINDFLTLLTTEMVHNLMLKVISWKDIPNHSYLNKQGVEGVFKYTPYLNTDITEIPINILNNMYHNLYTDNTNIYIYYPCCG